METAPAPIGSATVWGLLCGTGAALFWALGFVAARQGDEVGLSPVIIALHRYIWPALILFPMLATGRAGDLGTAWWRRAVPLAVFGGLPLALISYLGYLFVPLGHGAIIQPSCAALGGLILARLVLREPLPLRRVAGAIAIIVGLILVGSEALRTMGGHGVLGDLLFVTAGSFFAVFGILVRMWRITALRAAATTSVLSMAGLPLLVFYFDNMLAAGFWENLLQAAVQGGLAGASGIYLFTRAVALLGASRAVLFPSLVPPFTLLIGYLALGEVPSAAQLVGLVVVVVGFQLTQKG